MNRESTVAKLSRTREPGRWDTTTTWGQPGRLAVLVAAAAFALAACGGSSSPQVASLATTSTNGSDSAASTPPAGAATRHASSPATRPKGNATALVDEWATCMHSHGDPSQADPTIDAYGVINISIPVDAQNLSEAVHAGADPCSQYIAAAQSALRAANPVAPPPNQAELLKYVDCMRANGVPNYPYATGNKTDFNGTGVDPNSPFVQKANKLCGNKLGLPAWWINGTGPPGDVVVSSGPNGGPPPGGGGPNRPRPASGGNGGTVANSGAGVGG